MKSRLLALCIISASLTTSAHADLYGVYSNIRTYVASYAPVDTHQYLGYSAVSSIAGHSEAKFDDGTINGSAVADTFVTYGALHIDQEASSKNSNRNGVLATVTEDGNPSAAYFDRLYFDGANVGATFTIHCHAWLSDEVRVSGNHDPAWNVPQGFNGTVQIGSDFRSIQDFNAGVVVSNTGPAIFDVVGTVGSFLDISSTLYGDCDTFDTFNANPTSAIAMTIGTLNSTFESADPSVIIKSASGHDYTPAAVPEPATYATLGLGLLAVVRRRKRS